jgi:transposase
MFDRVAGLDVGKESVTVCVRTPGPRGGRRSETRTFKTTTGSLRVMRDWLVEAGVRIAAMESTSTYWKPPFYCLEEVMEVWLLNAAHMKAVPGRKSDVRDAEWIAQLLEHGLLRPSLCRRRKLSAADVDPLPNPVDGGSVPGDRPVGVDVGVESVWGALF